MVVRISFVHHLFLLLPLDWDCRHTKNKINNNSTASEWCMKYCLQQFLIKRNILRVTRVVARKFLFCIIYSAKRQKENGNKQKLSQGNVASYGSSFWLISKYPRQDLSALVMRIEHHHPENTVKKKSTRKKKHKILRVVHESYLQ